MIAELDLPARAVGSARLTHWAAQLLLPLTLLAVAVLVEVPRFSLTAPSLIDEWFGVAYSGSALHALLHGHYLSAGSDFQGRYRPGYSAIWNYAQWHLFGPPSLARAAAWGILRTAAFLVAVLLLARWLAGKSPSFRRPLLLLAPLAVVLTPQISVALTRFGPGEPMMVAGLVIGLALIGTGVRGLLLNERSRRRRVLAGVYAVVGYPIYLLGVYSKESSVALLVFVPFFVMWLWPWLRVQAARSRRRFAFVAALGALLITPLLQLGARLALAVIHSQSPWPNAHLTTGQKIFAAAISPFLGVPGVLGTWLWFIACQVAIVATVIAVRRRERHAWLLVGVLVTGFLMSAIPLARGPMPTWYYIPWIVAVATVAFRPVARANWRVVLLVIALVAVLVPVGTPSALADWTRTQQSSSEALNLAEGVVAAGCPLYLANFDIEQRVAIPLLFRFAHPSAVPDCAASPHAAYAVSWKNKALAPAFATHCQSTWQKLATADEVGFYRCGKFHSPPILDQYEASGEPTVTVVRVRWPARRPPPARIFQPLGHPKAWPIPAQRGSS